MCVCVHVCLHECAFVVMCVYAHACACVVRWTEAMKIRSTKASLGA